MNCKHCIDKLENSYKKRSPGYHKSHVIRCSLGTDKGLLNCSFICWDLVLRILLAYLLDFLIAYLLQGNPFCEKWLLRYKMDEAIYDFRDDDKYH